jgi:acyl carrier protein
MPLAARKRRRFARIGARVYLAHLQRPTFSQIQDATNGRRVFMDIREDIKSVLDETLNLNGASASWTDDTALLGSLPELTSIAVVGVLLALEEHFAIVLADDEMDAELFATLGNITRFVEGKLARGAT